MFLCRPGRRLSAAALDHTSAGRFIVQTSRDGTLTLRKGGTFRGDRCFSVPAADSGHPQRQRTQPQPVRDSPVAAPGLTDRAHWNRLAAVALNLSQTAQSSGFIGQPLVHASRRLGSEGEPAGNVLFTGHFGLFMHGCFSGTMQSRGASTKSTDAGETDNKEVIFFKTTWHRCLSDLRAHTSRWGCLGLFTGADPPVPPGRASTTMYSEAGLLHNCVTCGAVLHVRDMNRR